MASPISTRVRLTLEAIRAYDRLRLRRRMARQPGLHIDPTASTNFASAHFSLAPGARVDIGARVVTERRTEGVHIVVGRDATLSIAEDCWLRSDLGTVLIYVFDGASLTIGPECTMSACHLSAKTRLTIGRRTGVGPGSRVLDSDQHEFEDGAEERMAPVTLGDFVWVAADVTILRGVTIGSHSVIGTRSLVTSSVPTHTLAVGSPAREVGKVGDRSPLRL